MPSMGSSNMSQTLLIVYRSLSVLLILSLFFCSFFCFVLPETPNWCLQVVFVMRANTTVGVFFILLRSLLCTVTWIYLLYFRQFSHIHTKKRTLSVSSITLFLCLFRWASMLGAFAFVFSVFFLFCFSSCSAFSLTPLPLLPLSCVWIWSCLCLFCCRPELKIQLLRTRGTDWVQDVRRTLQLHLGCPAAACLFIWVCYCCGWEKDVLLHTLDHCFCFTWGQKSV